MDESLTPHVREQNRSRSPCQTCNPKPLAFEIFYFFDVFRADEKIGRGVARSGGDFEVTVGPLIPDNDVVGVDVSEVKLTRHQCLQLDIGSPDADQVDLNSFLRVQVFFQPDKKREVVEVFRYITGRQSLRASDDREAKRTRQTQNG